MKEQAARTAAAAGTLSAEALTAAIAAADTEAAAAGAAAVAAGEAAAAVRSEGEVNMMFKEQQLWEVEGRLFDWEREEMLAAVAVLPMLRHLKWTLVSAVGMLISILMLCLLVKIEHSAVPCSPACRAVVGVPASYTDAEFWGLRGG
jgi:hypothetical protein